MLGGALLSLRARDLRHVPPLSALTCAENFALFRNPPPHMREKHCNFLQFAPHVREKKRYFSAIFTAIRRAVVAIWARWRACALCVWCASGKRQSPHSAAPSGNLRALGEWDR